MKVILKADVKGSGKAGDLINVSDGYARNFLFPKNLAVPADKGAMNDLKNKEAAAEHHKQVEVDEAKALAAKLEGKSVTVKAKAGQGGRLFGSITAKEIAAALQAEFGIQVEKRRIDVSEIKAFGSYSATVKVYSGITAKITVVVTE